MHFAICIIHALVLQVLPSSTAQLQPEPDVECLLQTQAQQAHQVDLKSDQTIRNPENLCPAFSLCACADSQYSETVGPLSRTAPSSLTVAECQDHCRLFPAFEKIVAGGEELCFCCTIAEITTDAAELYSGATTSNVYKGGLASFPGGLQELCSAGDNCECASPSATLDQLSNQDRTKCANFCYLQTPPLLNFLMGTYTPPIVGFGPPKTSVCRCCTSSATVPNTDASYFGQVFSITPPATPGTALGDPHITTLDGHHYTLLKQGTFLLWRLKKAPIDWQIFTRYSGQQSYTKGVLLVDKSGGSARQVIEMTSKDCQWRARKAGTEWTSVKDDEIIAVPAGEDFATGFRVTKNGAGHNHVRFEVNTMGGKMEKAILSLSCRPHHHINLQLVMKERSEYQLVEGELKVARGGISTLQTDAEFAVDTKWEDLGGSHGAANYFKMDEEAVGLYSFSSRCSTEEEAAAHEMCTMHLGKMPRVDDQTFFKDCVYDVCHGAGEIAAELAAELLASTLAIEGA